MLPKAKRFQEFLRRLMAAAPASSAEEALDLVARTLHAVEEEFSGVACQPELWRTDGRLYPPQADARVKCPGPPGLRKYRNKGHYVILGLNGSIRIETLDAELVLDKPGRDGRKTRQLEVGPQV